MLLLLFNRVGLMAVPLEPGCSGADKELDDWFLACPDEAAGLPVSAWCLPIALLVITRPIGRFGGISLVFPVAVLFFLGIFLLAILNLERGQVVWKGRRVATP